MKKSIETRQRPQNPRSTMEAALISIIMEGFSITTTEKHKLAPNGVVEVELVDH